MTPPEYSVLLLAWDDADPSVAVLGGAALPPTLSLVYQLAAQHPVLAIYPHLPAAGAEAPETETTETPAPAVSAGPAPQPPEAAATAPEPAPAAGVRLLPMPAAAAIKPATTAPLQSRIVGLEELAPAPLEPLVPPSQATSAAAATPGITILSTTISRPQPDLTRSQWPADALVPGRYWQAPAAPYVGAATHQAFPPPPPAPPRTAVRSSMTPAKAEENSPETALADGLSETETTAAVAPAAAMLRPSLRPLAGDLNFDPDPELPPVTVVQPAAFDEVTEEIGAAEANDLSAPEDDLTLDAPAPAEAPAAPLPAATPTAPEPAAPLLHTPKLEGLNFRMIQYARQAAQLVRHNPGFGVIYAPSWPAWLAALEIRNSSRQPLVLYVAALADDFAGPAERGWLPELERMTLRRATLTLVPDEALRRRLLALYADLSGEVRVVAATDEAAVQRVLGEVAIG